MSTPAATVDLLERQGGERAQDERTLALVAAVLGVSSEARQVLVDRLIAYYAPDSDHCGTSFLDGTEVGQPELVVPADLFAVTTLGIHVNPAAARRLLHDTPYAERVEMCLSPMQLPLDATLAEAGPDVFGAMWRLHEAVLAAIEPHTDPGEDSRVTATAICARKRPELFPVLSQKLCRALQLPGSAHPLHCWRILRHVLAQPRLSRALADTYELARATAPRPRVDVYPLRQLYVLACHTSGPRAPASRR